MGPQTVLIKLCNKDLAKTGIFNVMDCLLLAKHQGLISDCIIMKKLHQKWFMLVYRFYLYPRNINYLESTTWKPFSYLCVFFSSGWLFF